jgi:hypothetical protein
MKEQNIAPNEFHLGITMAGAVSAGCYTGGVMDYFFEILDLWESAKNKKLDLTEEEYTLIPQHKVVLDVMGGASAGGMTTAMAAMYALNGVINPVTDPKSELAVYKQNIFYDSWVLLDDLNEKDKRKTFAKTWDLDDLSSGHVQSFLNSNFVDRIADRTFQLRGDLAAQVKSLPSYISPELEMLLSHCMLRGVPLEINFSTPIGLIQGEKEAPSHTTFEHLTLSHYKLNNGRQPDLGKYLWLNPYEKPYVDTLRVTTKATGAFPFGLKFRKFDQEVFTDEYIKSVTERIVCGFGRNRLKPEYELKWNCFPSPFNFVTVDGGTINNEPFGEVLGILKQRYGDAADLVHKPYGLIMIDPFPDVLDRDEPYVPPTDLLTLIPALSKTLREQSKVKRAEFLEAYSSDYTRGVIFPRKWKAKNVKEDYPIASESVEAFGGFLDIRFRHHDFFLGRDNARNFFRFYFSLEYDPGRNVHPIHRDWTPEMVQTFKVERDGKIFLPIIPDLHILKLRREKKRFNPFSYSVREMPQYSPVELFSMREKMEERIGEILELTKNKFVQKDKQNEEGMTQEWMRQYYHKSVWQKIKSWFIRKSFHFIFKITKGGLAHSLTESMIRWMLKDLEEKKLLKKA